MLELFCFLIFEYRLIFVKLKKKLWYCAFYVEILVLEINK